MKLRFGLKLIFTFFLLINKNVIAQYIVKAATFEVCKEKIQSPYVYDGYWMKDFIFDHNTKKIKGHFVAFEDEEYQIAFCSSGFEEKVKISIYYRKTRLEKRKKIYDSSKNLGDDGTFCPENPGDYFIEYEIPEGVNKQAKPAYVLILFGTHVKMNQG